MSGVVVGVGVVVVVVVVRVVFLVVFLGFAVRLGFLGRFIRVFFRRRVCTIRFCDTSSIIINFKTEFWGSGLGSRHSIVIRSTRLRVTSLEQLSLAEFSCEQVRSRVYENGHKKFKPSVVQLKV